MVKKRQGCSCKASPSADIYLHTNDTEFGENRVSDNPLQVKGTCSFFQFCSLSLPSSDKNYI